MAPRLFACFRKGSSSSTLSSTLVPKNPPPPEISPEELRRQGAVLVELFSSQGCKTSPEAELLVSRLGRGDFNLEMPVVVLAYHVDYWDHQGWKDPFGSSNWTVRQKAYVEALKLDTIFTPQVVVQGVVQCVGNDEEALINTIDNAPRLPSPAFQANFQRPTPDSLQVFLTGPLRTKIDNHGANVMVAIYESGSVIDCPTGENKGRILSNDYIVRRLEKLFTVKECSSKKEVSGAVNFSLWEGFNANKCGIVIFIQNDSHQILGSQSIRLPGSI
ncbi:hypothetical protein ACFE04_024331 [Oxalis oulophora]